MAADTGGGESSEIVVDSVEGASQGGAFSSFLVRGRGGVACGVAVCLCLPKSRPTRTLRHQVCGSVFECLSRYSPLKPIGKGAYGVVWWVRSGQRGPRGRRGGLRFSCARIGATQHGHVCCCALSGNAAGRGGLHRMSRACKRAAVVSRPQLAWRQWGSHSHHACCTRACYITWGVIEGHRARARTHARAHGAKPA